MAGIGFELRKLTRRDNLFGIAAGYGYAALATSGPWLFTVVSLAAIVLLGLPATTPAELAAFHAIVLYNFGFSLVLASPVSMITTRYLADAIHARKVEQVPAVMLGALSLIYAAAIPLAVPFYVFHTRLDSPTRLAALLNFLLICGIWLATVFLTALKNYRAVAFSFAAGLAAGIGGAGLLARRWSAAGMLMGFNLGLAAILFTLIARVLAEYPTRAQRPFEFLPFFRSYWELAAGALAYSAAVWVDKWILWFAPQREVLACGMLSYPDYETAMFLAYLSIVPSMAAFTLSIETGFFEKYLRFYGDIQRHVPLGRIQDNQRQLVQAFLDGARNFLVVQGTASIGLILLAPRLFEWLGIHFGQLAIFRFGVLGAFFHGGVLFLAIIISYFDERRILLALGALFLAANTACTLATLYRGFPYYGAGYALAALITFGCGFAITSRLLNHLPYRAFVCHNSSVTGRF